MIYTEILLIKDKCAIQRNNMKHLVVTAKQYELCVLMLITLFNDSVGIGEFFILKSPFSSVL